MITQGRFFSCIICLLAAFGLIYDSYAVAPVNPRAAESVTTSPRSSIGENVSRRAISTTRVRSVVPARATGAARGALTSSAARTPVSSTRTRVRVGAMPVTESRVARSARTNARAGKNTVLSTTNISRSAKIRATALFNDISKIGSGYAGCRDSYATCMDQICGQANETYRRCFCSSRFTQFRDTEKALDEAMIMLQQFEDNNLNAVDKTAAEVNAMYSATVGEEAIKKDTSASAKKLAEINDLLSGKTSATSTKSSGSLGILDLDFSTDMDDVWSNAADSIFSSSGQDLSTLEGQELFNSAEKQCSRLSQGACENDAVFSMSKSSYNILITQDCNAYEKSVNKKRETVAQAVREAEKYLREARLEEYRSHNSADVNECVAKVRAAILADTACGENYKRCLDPTGAYINGATGEPIYSPRLSELEKTISVGGIEVNGQDVISQNPTFDKFLENYRKYVTRELDTCRDISDFVWTEFKRNAIIEIAQAQTDKVEEVKSSCVTVMSECYSTQSQALISFDKNTATAAGALGRYAARDMCREKVVSCAALFGGDKCDFDARGHLTSNADCGLQSLLNYVSAVDDLNVAQKCNEALDEYVQNLCTPNDDKYEYPYNCKGLSPVLPESDENDRNSLPWLIRYYALQNCWDAGNKDDEKKFENLPIQVQDRVDEILKDIKYAMNKTLQGICDDVEGYWYPADDLGNPREIPSEEDYRKQAQFYNKVSGNGVNDPILEQWGTCYESTRMLQCLAYNNDGENTTENYASWDSGKQTCSFTTAWYESMCGRIGGFYDGGTSYIMK